MLKVGTINCRETDVTDENTAIGCGSGGLPIYSTPSMVELMETTCYESVLDDLEEGQGTVGISLNIQHVSAVPVGLTVTCRSELVEIEGRKLTFQVEVTDETGIVGTGTHERFIIDNERFMDKTNSKRNRITEMGNPSKPQGAAGKQMLKRMNRSHYELTGWGLEYLTFAPGDHILDVGCGGGQTLYRLAESYPETTLAGIDYSDVSVELSRETNERFISVGRTSIQKASADELPFNDDVFDKVITVESFYFWPDHDKGLKEILRVLKPGGKLLIICEVYGDAPLSPRERENIQKYTMFNPTRAEYRELMKRNGFREVDIHVRENEKCICVIGTK